jgi:4-hydroxy-tetrahydrodipicolinate synthase
MKFEGIYTPIITPHAKDGAIDRDAFRAMVEFLVASGVQGIISGGSTGEYYAQTIAERIELATLAREVIGKRTALIVGLGAIRQADSITMAKAAAKLGASAILLGSPPYAVPTEKENAQNALAIDRAAGLPIMLYNYPDRMGVNMGQEFLDRVSRSPNFCAIKESSGDINRFTSWPATIRISSSPAAWTTRRWSFSHGARAAGSAAAAISCRRSTWRSIGPASSRAISTRGAASCRPCCR